MEIECRFFATFRAAVGEKSVVLDVSEGITVGELLATLQSEYEALDGALVDDEIPPQVSVMQNGRDVTHLDGTETMLEDGDRLSVFPPVAGGSNPEDNPESERNHSGAEPERNGLGTGPRETVGYGVERRERSYRGISTRLAQKYLTGLGGEPVDADRDRPETGRNAGTIVGDGWRATLSSDTVEIGRSLELTEVTVAFEGDPERLDELVSAFSRKAMRAGG